MQGDAINNYAKIKGMKYNYPAYTRTSGHTPNK